MVVIDFAATLCENKILVVVLLILDHGEADLPEITHAGSPAGILTDFLKD